MITTRAARAIEYQEYLHHRSWAKNNETLRSRESFFDDAVASINAMSNVELLEYLDLLAENPTLGTIDARYNR